MAEKEQQTKTQSSEEPRQAPAIKPDPRLDLVITESWHERGKKPTQKKP